MFLEFFLLILALLVAIPLFKSLYYSYKKEQLYLINLANYLVEIQDEIDGFSPDNYLQKKWLYENYINEVIEISKENPKVLKYLDKKNTPDILKIIEQPSQWLYAINQNFIDHELQLYHKYFQNIEKKPLTTMQSVAVVTHEQNNLILAGAGSGKTSVIVAKIGYILSKGYANEEEILVLAFNTKAQEELQERIGQKLNININIRTFHSLGNQIANKAYKKPCLDFDEMITKATKALEEKRYKSPYRYIFIDEFQDISQDRNSLILALKEQNSANVTVVGDDWQSINAFAGADIGIIKNFESYYGESATIKLDYTFRFNKQIANASTQFILKNPEQIIKKIKTVKESSPLTLYLRWYRESKKIDDNIEEIIKLIAKKVGENSKLKSIKILSRYNFQSPKNLSELQEEFSSKFEISFNTIHGSKGLEADFILITHLERGKFGFPSELERDENEPFPHAEERRLFYVALTRAKEKIYFLAHREMPSSFIVELKEENNILELNM